MKENRHKSTGKVWTGKNQMIEFILTIFFFTRFQYIYRRQNLATIFQNYSVLCQRKYWKLGIFIYVNLVKKGGRLLKKQGKKKIKCIYLENQPISVSLQKLSLLYITLFPFASK